MTEGPAVEKGEEQDAVVEVPVLKFSVAHKKFSESLKTSFEANRFEDLEKTSLQLVTSDKDNKKLILDQCFREYLILQLVGVNVETDLDLARRFVMFAIQAAKKELCNPTTPIQVLADIFDMTPLSACEVLFKTIEIEVSTWRSKEFFTPIRNSLLRICNDLLRRLSRTQNTVFCGRILLFLAKFFPFSERSGLNVISEFNLDNVTSFSKVPLFKPEPEKKSEDKPEELEVSEEKELVVSEEKEEKEKEEKEEEKAEKENGKEDNGKEEGEEEEKEEKGEKEKESKKEKKDDKKDDSEAMEIELVVEEEEKLEVEQKVEAEECKAERIDREFKLYSKFWALQNFFRSPTLCYQKEQWDTFCSQTSDILGTFSKRKLDNHKNKRAEVPRETENTIIDQYFAKYLTNQNLLGLQINDSNFRRYVYIQLLIVFQYFQTGVKSKTEAQVLTTEQTKWIDEHRKKVFKLIEETPPNGKHFSISVKAVLKRELIWNSWKNEGCPSFLIKPKEGENKEEKAEPRARKRKMPLGEQMKREAKAGKINLGNKGLTKLWNLNPDNLESCKEAERNFLPSLEAYFEDAIMEIDPKNKVDEEYKRVNKGEWGWRALRLMSRRSQHFFLVGNSQISKLPEYLTMMMGKMAQEFGKPIQAESSDVEMNENGDAENGEEEEDDESGRAKLTDDQIATLAVRLAEHWKALVSKLGLSPETVESCKEGDSDEAICLLLLNAYVEQEGEGATPDEIRYMTARLKLDDLIAGVF